MKDGPGAFNVVASEQYRSLGDADREKLSELCEERREKVLSVKDVKREGAKLFRKIQSQVVLIATPRSGSLQICRYSMGDPLHRIPYNRDDCKNHPSPLILGWPGLNTWGACSLVQGHENWWFYGVLPSDCHESDLAAVTDLGGSTLFRFSLAKVGVVRQNLISRSVSVAGS